ncbi:MAG: IS701 family transposase [Anaerolineae bacterium]|nr:IS701 family transposase [Anaerolineae bacterium]
MQRVLNEALWDAAAVRRQLRRAIIQQLGYESGIGVIDESGFVKWGDKSAGVGHQYCGRVGKVENCQVGVYWGYVAPTGAAFLDCRLYLPQAWCDDRARCQAAKIPDDVPFQTKPQIAQAILKQAWAEDVPMQRGVGDTLYGNSPGLREAIHHHQRYYVLAIGAPHQVMPADHRQIISLHTLVSRLAETDWERLCFRVGAKGLIWYEWQAVRITLANDTIGEQWLLMQRPLDEKSTYIFWLSNAPVDTPIVTFAAVALARHPLEHLLEEAEGQVGMADYEVRLGMAGTSR